MSVEKNQSHAQDTQTAPEGSIRRYQIPYGPYKTFPYFQYSGKYKEIFHR